MVKYLVVFGIIYLIYKFYNPKQKEKNQIDDLDRKPTIPEKELDDYTDYEELE